MSAWELPTSLEIGGTEYPIRTDFRAILDILSYFADPDYENDEKWMICMDILFGDPQIIPFPFWEEAQKKIVSFIDMGLEDDGRPTPRAMDWEQDAPIIIPAVNRVMGSEVRSMKYLHWWTFLGAYMEIGDSLFSSVLHIRAKRAAGQKLEKEEQKFYRENKRLIDLKRRYSKEELEEQKRLLELF